MNRLNGTASSLHLDDFLSFNISCKFLESGIPPAPAVAAMATSISEGGVTVPIWWLALVSVISLLGYHLFCKWWNDGEDDEVGAARVSEPAGAEGGQESSLFCFSGKVSITADEFIQLPAVRIGNGMVGETHKIILPRGMEVAAKRLRVDNGRSKEEFYWKVQLLRRLDLEHENLGRIIGCYSSEDINQRMIIFEHVDGHSLFQFLHRLPNSCGGGDLNSTQRLLIAKGIARGLFHLHRTLAGERVPHGNLKSSNVIIPSGRHLRANSICPKLVNFGLIPLLSPSELHRLAVGSTPEATSDQPLLLEMSPKTDIYCLGILLLELITGINPRGSEEQLVNWVSRNMQFCNSHVLDAVISRQTANHGFMHHLLEIALECTADLPEERPAMSELLERIEAIIGFRVY